MPIPTGMNVQAPYSRVKKNETNADMYRSRPDIIIQERNCITLIESKCPFEMNLLKSHNYKITKYQNLFSPLLNPSSHFKLILLESPTHGFTRSLRTTFEIYLNGKNWILQELSKSIKK